MTVALVASAFCLNLMVLATKATQEENAPDHNHWHGAQTYPNTSANAR
jgi:hypothetical protein